MPLITCKKCNKLFDHKGDYDRHINRKKSCDLPKGRKKPVKKKEENSNLIRSFKDEKRIYLTDEEFKDVFSSIKFSIGKMLEKIHFNRKYPENHNIKLSSIKTGYACAKFSEQWKMIKTNSLIEDSAENIYDIITNKGFDFENEEENDEILDFAINKLTQSIDNGKFKLYTEDLKMNLINGTKLIEGKADKSFFG